jgi:aldose 1-epimerase
MVPFIGRIGNGRFVFDRVDYRLKPNMPPEPHAIHGRGWQTSWTINHSNNGDIVMEQTYHGSGDWPWSYHARQNFSAEGNTLHVNMALKNLSETQMPAGLGWHPYFPKAGAQLEADTSAIWANVQDGIIGDRPSRLKPENDLRFLRQVDTLNLDSCYTMSRNVARIEWPERCLGISVSSGPTLNYLTVFTPPEENYFCIEPVSHIPDAINNPLSPNDTGFRVLQPGESLKGHTAISVTLGKR